MDLVYAKWLQGGQLVDPTGVPHEVKQYILLSYARAYGLYTFVETGTCHGAMVKALVRYFERIETIEMYEPNFVTARRMLAHYSHVACHLGDSAEVLRRLADTISDPALFFLDAHYSGGGTARGEVDTPIVSELEAIARRANAGDVVVIDDARLFAGQPYHTVEFRDYPSLEWIQDFVVDNFPSGMVTHFGDEFVIHPRDPKREVKL